MHKLGLRNLVDPRRAEFPKFVGDDDLLALTKAIPKVEYDFVYPPVDDQGNFGTCVGWGTSKVFEFFMHKRKGKLTIISKRAVFSEIKSQFYPNDPDDDGAQVSDGLRILEQGYVLDADYPFDPNGTFAQFLSPVPSTLIHTDFDFKSYVAVNATINDMKMALLKHGPLAIGISWANEWMDPGPDGRLPSTNLTSAGGHCVSITGYDDTVKNLDSTLGAFHLINNWTAAWSDHGYAWLPYSSDVLPEDVFTVNA